METQIKNLIPDQLHRPQAAMENFDEVELTPEEINQVLFIAKQKKAAKLREMAYWEKVNKPVDYPKLNAAQIWNFALNKISQGIPDFKIDEKNKEIFTLLSYYFTGDPLFKAAGFDLNKGIALIGPVGCGKTSMFRAFASNPVNSFVEVSCRKVANDYSIDGATTVSFYSDLREVYPQNYFGQKHIGTLFDDLGTESVKKHFGNETNVMEDILLNRYDNNLRGKTHITANLSVEQIDEIYGARVRSRMKEMFNWITFDVSSPDRRK